MEQGLGSLPEVPAQRESAQRFYLLCLGILVVILLVMAATFGPSYLGARQYGWRNQCKSNIKNLATALERYARDNGGRYPVTMEKLIPQYLTVLPTCPASQTGYGDYRKSTAPDRYSFCCVGNNHARTYQGDNSDNLPAFSSEKGLIEARMR